MLLVKMSIFFNIKNKTCFIIQTMYDNIGEHVRCAPKKVKVTVWFFQTRSEVYSLPQNSYHIFTDKLD